MENLHPFRMYNTATVLGLQGFVLAFFKYADDVRVIVGTPGNVDVLILVKPKWWWFLTFGYMQAKVEADARLILELNAPIAVKVNPKIFYKRILFERAVGIMS